MEHFTRRNVFKWICFSSIFLPINFPFSLLILYMTTQIESELHFYCLILLTIVNLLITMTTCIVKDERTMSRWLVILTSTYFFINVVLQEIPLYHVVCHEGVIGCLYLFILTSACVIGSICISAFHISCLCLWVLKRSYYLRFRCLKILGVLLMMMPMLYIICNNVIYEAQRDNIDLWQIEWFTLLALNLLVTVFIRHVAGSIVHLDEGFANDLRYFSGNLLLGIILVPLALSKELPRSPSKYPKIMITFSCMLMQSVAALLVQKDCWRFVNLIARYFWNQEVEPVIMVEVKEDASTKDISTMKIDVTICKDDDCSICLQPFKVKESLFITKECKHSFHFECFKQWMLNKDQCPLCRTVIQREIIELIFRL